MSQTKDLPVLMFFNKDEAKTIEAIVSRIIPSENGSPGAKEAGALIFIDQALAGYYRHLQTFYRQGLIEIQSYCKEIYGNSFISLTEDQQDHILRSIERFIVKDSSASNRVIDKKYHVLEQFFAVVYEHTMEGTFCDPLYGGNRDTIGWKMIGFPGAQWGYTQEQMKLGFDVNQIKISTLTDIQNEYKPVITEVKL